MAISNGRRVLAALGIAALAGTTPLAAAGFDFRQQSARAIGVGGAFTAQVNDPSAIFYNPGALALQKKKKGLSAGVSLLQTNESLYQGLPPGIGAGTTAEQETSLAAVPYAFASAPLGANFVTGLGIYSPYRHETEWANPGAFAGRFLSTASSIESYDVAVPFAIGGGGFGIGANVIYRTSKISATRRLGASLAGVTRDVGTLELETDNQDAIGWSAGFLVRPGDRFALGATYRARMESDYVGIGRLTQITTGDTQFDQLIAASFPFGRDLALGSRLEFPAEATVGIALGLGASTLLEVDATRTEWSRVQNIAFVFNQDAILNTTYRLDFEDTTSYRAGLRFQFPTGPILRAGVAFDPTPQPATTVGTFLPDANRVTYTAGFGLDWLDLAVAWTTYEQRITARSVEGLNGNFRRNEWLVAITATK